MSTSPQTPGNAFSKFEDDVKKRQITGSTAGSIIGWMLLMTVMMDLLLNGEGLGSLELVLETSIRGADKFSEGWFMAVQATMFALGALALSTSPWRLGLLWFLRDTWPAKWLADFFKDDDFDRAPAHYLRRRWREILIDVGVLSLSIITLRPLTSSLMVLWPFGRFFAGGLVLFTAYCVSKITITLVKAASHDAASAIVMVTTSVACFYCAFASFGESQTLGQLMGTPPYDLFRGHQSSVFVLLSAVVAILLQGGSIKHVDPIELVVTHTDIGVYPVKLFPAFRRGYFMPVPFVVEARGVSLVLLSRPDNKTDPYEVCSLREEHDLTKCHWELLNLSALSSKTNTPDHGLTYKSSGDSRFFQCDIDFMLLGRSAERHNRRLQNLKAEISIGDYAWLVEDVINQPFPTGLWNVIRKHIDGRLDKLVDPPPPDGGDPFGVGLDGIRRDITTSADRTVGAMDDAVTEFQATCDNSIRLLRDVEIEEAQKKARVKIEAAHDSFLDGVSFAGVIENNQAKIQKHIRTNLEGKGREILGSLLLADDMPQTAEKGKWSCLIQLIDLEVNAVSVTLAPEAKDQVSDVIELEQKRVREKREGVNSEIRAILKRYAERIAAQAGTVISSPNVDAQPIVNAHTATRKSPPVDTSPPPVAASERSPTDIRWLQTAKPGSPSQDALPPAQERSERNEGVDNPLL